MILITSLVNLFYISLSFFFHFKKKKKTVMQDCCWCLFCLAAEDQFQWVRDCKSRLNLNPMALGTPNLEKMFSFKNFNTILWSSVLKGIASTHFDT